MRNDIFEAVRQLVPTRAAAELYGFHPNRAGYICCPFHNEKTASLKLYDDGGWHCFGCGAGGSSIDFTARLQELSPVEAVKRLNEDFRLGLSADRPPGRRVAQQRQDRAKLHQDFESWRSTFISMLNAMYLAAHLLRGVNPDKLTAGEALTVRWKPAFEYWSDRLSYGGLEEQMQIFRDRRDIKQLCKTIWTNTPVKSGRA